MPVDSIYVNSPVGFLALAVRNPFTERLEREGRIPHTCPYKCLKTCQGPDSIYCIADALLKSAEGNVVEGLVFSGSNVGKVNRMYHVDELIKELVEECEEELERKGLNFGGEQ